MCYFLQFVSLFDLSILLTWGLWDSKYKNLDEKFPKFSATIYTSPNNIPVEDSSFRIIKTVR